MMYTVFKDESCRRPVYDRLGLVCFVHTLADARESACPGNVIVGWSSSGYARSKRLVGPDGKARLLPGRHN